MTHEETSPLPNSEPVLPPVHQDHPGEVTQVLVDPSGKREKRLRRAGLLIGAVSCSCALLIAWSLMASWDGPGARFLYTPGELISKSGGVLGISQDQPTTIRAASPLSVDGTTEPPGPNTTSPPGIRSDLVPPPRDTGRSETSPAATPVGDQTPGSPQQGDDASLDDGEVAGRPVTSDNSEGTAAPTSPGNSGGAPGQGGQNPGGGGDPPGQSGGAPGNSGGAPGQGGQNPGNGGDLPTPPSETDRQQPTTQPDESPTPSE